MTGAVVGLTGASVVLAGAAVVFAGTFVAAGCSGFGSGAVAYAHKDQVHYIDLTIPQLWLTMRRRGAQSSLIYARLAELKAEWKL